MFVQIAYFLKTSPE